MIAYRNRTDRSSTNWLDYCNMPVRSKPTAWSDINEGSKLAIGSRSNATAQAQKLLDRVVFKADERADFANLGHDGEFLVGGTRFFISYAKLCQLGSTSASPSDFARPFDTSHCDCNSLLSFPRSESETPVLARLAVSVND